MGIADYLSRHPNSPPTGENMSENHVISIIISLKYTLFTRQRKSANQKARELNAQTLLALSKTRLRSITIRMHPIRRQVIHTDQATQTNYERDTQETSRTNKDDASR